MRALTCCLTWRLPKPSSSWLLPERAGRWLPKRTGNRLRRCSLPESPAPERGRCGGLSKSPRRLWGLAKPASAKTRSSAPET